MKMFLYFALFIIGFCGCLSNKPLLVILLGTPFCILLLVYIKLAWRSQKNTKETKPIKTESNESLLKAIKDYNTLQDLSQKITSNRVRKRLIELQHTAEGILDYLKQNSERMSAAEEFIEIYQGRAVSLMNQYLSLEKTKFSCREMDEAKIHIEKVLSSLNKTYKKEFKKILDFQFMNFHAEADAFQWIMGKSEDTTGYTNIPVQEPKKEEGFSKRNYDFPCSPTIDIIEPAETKFVECGILLLFTFVAFVALSFFRGMVESDSYFVWLIELIVRIILTFFLAIFWGIGIGELTKENHTVLRRRWDFS